MRHKNKRLQLSRFTSWHKATLKSLARNMVIHQSIKTTLSRAKAARPLVEKLIALAKSNTLSARRRAFEILGDHNLVSRLFKETAPLFEKRGSGFTRIISLSRRRGDNANLVVFELTEKKIKDKKKSLKAVKVEPVKEHNTKEGDVAIPKAKERFETERKAEKEKKPGKKFLGGIRSIFKKERDSL